MQPRLEGAGARGALAHTPGKALWVEEGGGQPRPLAFTSYSLTTPTSQRKPCLPSSAFLPAPFPAPPSKDLWF